MPNKNSNDNNIHCFVLIYDISSYTNSLIITNKLCGNVSCKSICKHNSKICKLKV